ncbi:hypothetical protein SDJN02_20493, partial [Cucurbita argyrosperma subsp. argyrosperma]
MNEKRHVRWMSRKREGLQLYGVVEERMEKSLDKSIVGMSEDEIKAVACVGLSCMSLINLWGMVLGLNFLSSCTSSMCPTLIVEIGTGAIESGELETEF